MFDVDHFIIKFVIVFFNLIDLSLTLGGKVGDYDAKMIETLVRC